MSATLTIALQRSSGVDEPLHVERQISRRFMDVLYIKSSIDPVVSASTLSDAMSVMTLSTHELLRVSDNQLISVTYHLPKLHEEVTNVKSLYDIQYAEIVEGYNEYIIKMDDDITHVRLPQQPFTVKCGNLDIDCSIMPVQISSNAQIPSLLVVPNKAYTNIYKFFIGTRHKEFNIDFGITYHTDASILYMPKSYALRVNELASAYMSDRQTPNTIIRPRSWMTSRYDSKPVHRKVCDNSLKVGAFIINAGVAYLSQTIGPID